MSERSVRAGVVGVGSMGENHARVYDDLPETTLAGVFDVDDDRAATVADRYDTRAHDLEDLLDAVEVASIAVPTAYHYEMARACIDAGVDVLVEKPFVADHAAGRDLRKRAADAGVTIQVGHVERFNPVVDAVRSLLADREVVSVSASRVGPPPDRDIGDSAVLDLMIHDVDVVMDLVDGSIRACDAFGTADGDFASATLAFDSGVAGRLTASRVARQTRRELTVTTTNCRIEADYVDQTVELRRAPAAGEAVAADGGVPEGTVVERVPVTEQEPLRNELRAFVEAAITGTPPLVSASDGLAVLDVVQRLDDAAETPRDRQTIRAQVE